MKSHIHSPSNPLEPHTFLKGRKNPSALHSGRQNNFLFLDSSWNVSPFHCLSLVPKGEMNAGPLGQKGKEKSISGKEEKQSACFHPSAAGISLWGQASRKASQGLWNGVRVIPGDFLVPTVESFGGPAVGAIAPKAFFVLHWFPWILAYSENPRERSQLSCPVACSWLSWICQEIPANRAPIRCPGPCNRDRTAFPSA